MKRILFLTIILFNFYSYSQNENNKRLDSLLNISKTQKELPLISTLNEISWEYKNSNIDSALFYAKKALKKANKINNKSAISFSYNSIANCFEGFGYLDSARIYHHKSLDLKLQIKDKVGAADSYNNLGIVYDLNGDFDLALKNYFKALHLYESEKVSFDKVPMVLGNIGIVYKKQKKYDKVLDYYNRALKIYEDNNYDFGIVVTKGNIGSVFLKTKDYNKAIKYSNEAKELYNKLGYHRYVPYMINNIAIAKDSLKYYKAAQENYKTAIILFKETQNLYENVYAQIGLANSFYNEKRFKEAQSEAKVALEILHEKGFKEFEVQAFKLLSNIEKNLGNYKEAYFYSNKYAIGKDSLFEENKTKAIFELETKYQTEKKEKEILSQRADIAEKELNINQKNTQIIGLSILAIVLSILGYLLFNQQKLKNQQLKKEGELKEALIKIESQNKLQEQRLSISRDLHDNIGAQLTFIISSIDNLQYGFKITNEKLNNKLSNISAFTKDTIYELRDTIWAMNKSEISLEDLQIRVTNYIEKANMASANTIFQFNVDSDSSNETIFSSVQGMNIYRIIQEAINNAIKYAEATSIKVNFKHLNNQFEISILDDGKGFDIAKVEFGNGLNNIRKRAKDIGATIAFNSDTDGTHINLMV
ncbi:MAG: sensor histidine kinase [Flaviramulus sp.]|nr:sensor histidine kinase [Flaviramulus sp.]